VLEDPARRTVAPGGADAASSVNRKRNMPTTGRRKKVKMRMEMMTRKRLNRSFKMLLMQCALMEVHLCTPLTSGSSSGPVRSMQ
jgi:hypothetical protein